MRDVIVVGAGGGGAVIAKELAGRGLDVLLLEAGPRFADPEHDWTHFESDAQESVERLFPLRAGRPRAAALGARDRPEHAAGAALRRGRYDQPLSGQLAARRARRVRRLRRAPTATATTSRICFRSAIASWCRTTNGSRRRCRSRRRRWACASTISSRARSASACRSRPPRTSPGRRSGRSRTQFCSRTGRPARPAIRASSISPRRRAARSAATARRAASSRSAPRSTSRPSARPR